MIAYHIMMYATNSSGVGVPGESASLHIAIFHAYIIIGPVVLGALVNACLFGCLIVQTYLYYANFPNDHRGIRFMVSETGMKNTNH